VDVPYGAGWLALVVAACWAADTAAYAVGKTLGRHKLCPSISPGKTVEGAVGGLIGAMLLTFLLGQWLGLPTGHALALGALLGVAGQLGDLAESKLKRWAGVKDSGSILPGHGGVLDRFDSLLVNAPLAYYYLRFIAGMQ
jgi:phosphatidate cytidylyltransferase